MRQLTVKGLDSAFALPLFLFSASIGLVGCSDKDSAEADVSFARQIAPMLQDHCLECHTPGEEGYETSGLDMSTYDTLMKGTEFGSVITPGNSISSTLMRLVEGRADPAINMPHGDRPPLSADQIQLLSRWIDEGAMNN